jgi:hypothetical protein
MRCDMPCLSVDSGEQMMIKTIRGKQAHRKQEQEANPLVKRLST